MMTSQKKPFNSPISSPRDRTRRQSSRLQRRGVPFVCGQMFSYTSGYVARWADLIDSRGPWPGSKTLRDQFDLSKYAKEREVVDNLQAASKQKRKTQAKTSAG